MREVHRERKVKKKKKNSKLDEENTDFLISLLFGLKKQNKTNKSKFIDIEKRSVVTRGERG